ncbi:MAG: rRNA maturation RNase YbeY [Nitrospirota bacterium]|nr:rRNA maturation RNase YbeY [Nitrospirota bacterium]MDE3118278.1 rRNA maturation RNase YbeY [Nitrospirota bacterium]MDE3225298.1 rRNA maturation RNase YbeY [Nitrospirota bacterium]
MPVTVRCSVRRIPLRRTAVETLAQRILVAAGAPSAELSLLIVGDHLMRRLNGRYRRKAVTTDVLAFPMREAPGPNPLLLGDVVISLPQAARQARAQNVPLNRELAQLLVHGILHLLGYDHERSPADAHRMQRKERTVLSAVSPVPALVHTNG